MFIKSNFNASWWLSNRHLQTVLAKLFRKTPTLALIDETIELPDGDFLALAWTEIPSKLKPKPIIVILHGLEGSKDSHYVQGLMSACKERGWIALIMHFRGCNGKPNRQAASYHSGDTRDITFLAERLKNLFQHSPLFLVGFSLGGNVVSKYLAEQVDSPFMAASIICAPLNLAKCSDAINTGFARFYQHYLLSTLKEATKEKVALGLVTHISADAVDTLTTIRAFDEQVTAPLNGFNNAEHYYQQASGITTLHTITLPCLVIHAEDDPFLGDKTIDITQPIPEHMTIEVSRKGGHMGFISGNNPLKPTFWLDQRIPKFIEQQL